MIKKKKFQHDIIFFIMYKNLSIGSINQNLIIQNWLLSVELY